MKNNFCFWPLIRIPPKKIQENFSLINKWIWKIKKIVSKKYSIVCWDKFFGLKIYRIKKKGWCIFMENFSNKLLIKILFFNRKIEKMATFQWTELWRIKKTSENVKNKNEMNFF